ncbi:MAG: energy-coupling factor transporter transmembrane protein EcfT [Spirochaetales bacterium]|nr:energy-coupling factor transporter transmembrane protein EcfT [Spirochaetales bacterium]
MTDALLSVKASPQAIKLDPRTKLFLMFVISTIMISGSIEGEAAYVRLVLMCVPFVLLLTVKRLKEALLYVFFCIVAWFGEAFLVYSTTGILNILIVMLSGLILRFIPIVVLGYYLVSSTHVGEFVAAMERMRVSQKLIIPMSVMFRFFPTVAEESRAIGDAMRMRGLGNKGFFSNPVTLLEYRLVPLMVSIVKIGDELSAAALTRGLGGPGKRTNIFRIGFGPWDVVLLTLVTAAAAVYLLA